MTGQVCNMELQRFCDVKIGKELANQKLAISALVVQSELKGQANGGHYLFVKIRDKGKEEVAKLWNATETELNAIQPGHAYDFIVDVKPYSASPTGVSLIVTKFQESAESPANFAEWAPDVNLRATEIINAMNGLAGTVYFNIVTVLMQENWNRFVMLPAGKTMHHTEAGGLVWHTASVLGVATAMAKHYEAMYGRGLIDYNLLTAGAILHDIGKVEELTVDETSMLADYSPESIFGSHIVIGVRMIDRMAMKYNMHNTEEVKLLEHLVASHHGTIEFGSIAIGVVPEAIILSKADHIDAEMWRHAKALRAMTPGEKTTEWLGKTPVNYYKASNKINETKVAGVDTSGTAGANEHQGESGAASGTVGGASDSADVSV